jgi:uncharacterized protein
VLANSRIMDRRLFLCLPALFVSHRAFAQGKADKLIAAARAQIGRTLHYDPSYVKLSYPGGDVPMARGVCTDVVIRAYREALEIDLQKLVHEDMKKSFASYPKNWGLKRPDKNIDHRRVPNLQTYFNRRGAAQPVSEKAADYAAGDLVTMMLPGNLPHIGIVSDQKNTKGVPLFIHNIGWGAREDDALLSYKHTGRYRFQVT